MTDQLAEDVLVADTTRDELCSLASEVENQNELFLTRNRRLTPL